MVRIAVIGLGSMGKRYADMIYGGLIDGLALTHIVTRSEANQAYAYEHYDNVKVLSTTKELYEDNEFDAVLIVTPHKLHPAQMIEAAIHGKHIMCDKPVGIDIGSVKEAEKVIREHNVVYAVMFHQRLYPKYQYIKKQLDSGKYGNIHRISVVNTRYFRTVNYHKSSSWRSSFTEEGGGALINQAQHLLDIWYYMFGMPNELYANIPFGKYNDFEVDDEVMLLMNYENGTSGQLLLTTGEAISEERLEIVGDLGKLVMVEDEITEYFHSSSSEYRQTTTGFSNEYLDIEKHVTSFASSHGTDNNSIIPSMAPYVGMLENFTKAITDNEPLVTPGEEGYYSLELANAAYVSATKRTVVKFPLDCKEFDECLKELQEREKN
ncbi:MAG: Gfo/Idh/MocA family oxidoreductase [Erysipelotrichales bacterium]|nr:Gfo/Idh/MocA family oxidoreductase [Erysipelotrichales bacterium]